MFDWENELKSLAEFIQTKDAEYGQTYDKAGKILEILLPDGISPDKYNTISIYWRLIEKIARGLNTNDDIDIWRDIVGLGLNGLKIYDEKKQLDDYMANYDSSVDWSKK